MYLVILLVFTRCNNRADKSTAQFLHLNRINWDSKTLSSSQVMRFLCLSSISIFTVIKPTLILYFASGTLLAAAIISFFFFSKKAESYFVAIICPVWCLAHFSAMLLLCKHTYIKHDLLLQFLTFIHWEFGGKQQQTHEKQSSSKMQLCPWSCKRAREEKTEWERASWLCYT